ncbi:hypothetical protein J2752_001100 [Halarchaeum rubridurum]|uniref:HVO-0234-like beta-propeller domain-containing protein n=1 Tax=Halarchaeum rubridurum TaxID=489911 RepID=A0A830FLB1_9EURY|nr:hypothetical protein [Halarchaeum rubridurum]MBP1954219.1 hypothetical protein [Halarchaeum rubridurum]GGM58262.1 hypothetical protein GCM10009017_05530 [Halarchaeum rubridurum]
MSDHDISLDEKRVYAEQTGTETLLVGTDRGLAAVAVSGDQIGEFALCTTTEVRDVAVSGTTAAVADREDVRTTDAGRDAVTGDPAFSETGFGDAVAVSYADGALLAAGPKGRVAARENDAWAERGTAPEARRADGALLATVDGVYRVTDADVAHAGLDDTRDVAAGSTRRRARGTANGEGRPASTGPWAATADGVYRLGNGWLAERDGRATAVAARADHAAAVVEDTLYEHDGDGWRERDCPLTDLADVAYGAGALYAVDSSGTVAVDAGHGWRTRTIGLPGVAAIGVVTDER